MRILLVEDDGRVASFVGRGLAEHGYAVEAVEDCAAAERRLAAGSYDLIVLDRMLPDESGLELCRRLRQRNDPAPVLMLTALSATEDKIAGLDAGADDYLTKPFELSELLARVRALLRRAGKAGAGATSILEYSGLRMDLVRRTVHRDGKRIRLTPREFTLLELFLRNPERVLSRAEIGQAVWNLDFESSNVLEVFVSALRRKVDRAFEVPLIQTVIGTGYVLSREPRP